MFLKPLIDAIEDLDASVDQKWIHEKRKLDLLKRQLQELADLSMEDLESKRASIRMQSHGTDYQNNCLIINHCLLIKRALESLNVDILKREHDVSVEIMPRTRNLSSDSPIQSLLAGPDVLNAFLKDWGVDLHARDPDDLSLLDLLADFSEIDLIKRLIELGADINQKNNQGDTLLAQALSTKKSVSQITELLECGADMGVMSEEGWSILHDAAYWGNSSYVALLPYATEEILSRETKNGFTVLDCVINSDNHQMVMDFIRAGADVHQTNVWGRGILMTACSGLGPSFDILEVLIDAGVNPNQVDLKGNSALHYLLENRSSDLEHIEFLVSHGALLDLKNTNQEKPIDVLQKSHPQHDEIKKRLNGLEIALHEKKELIAITDSVDAENIPPSSSSSVARPQTRKKVL